MNKIKELTAHIRRLAEKGYIVDYNTPNELNNALNQIDIFSELMNEVETKLKEPNFYIVNSKKYLNDEQRNSVAEKIAQMSTDDDDDFEDDYTFTRCSRCDGHDACEDFGCALSAGIKIKEDIV